MKIYNYIKIDIDTEDILEEDSFEYDGVISECKGNVSVPPPSEEEKALQAEILDQLKSSRALQEQFLPIMMQTAGYKYDDSGKLVKMNYDEYLESLDPAMRMQYENLALIQEQANKALKGELPVSSALEKGLESQKKNLEEDLSRRLGSQWSQSSAGIAAQQEFNQGAESLREQARQGLIQNYSGIGLAGNQAYGVNPSSQLGIQSSLSSSGTGLIPYYNAALQPYQNQRNMQLQANMANAQNKTAGLNSLYSGLGTMAGFGLTRLFPEKG